MTRKFNAIFASCSVLAALTLAAGCASETTTPPAASTMDLSNVPPPPPLGTPLPAESAAAPTPVAPAPAPAAEPAGPAGARTHKIEKGDTIYNLAAKFYGSGSKANQEKILAANPGLIPTKMFVGKTINVPE